MVGATFSEKELDAAMAELDPSGDGQVDFAEFKAYWVRFPSRTDESRPAGFQCVSGVDH